jgi:hypothetical protein
VERSFGRLLQDNFDALNREAHQLAAPDHPAANRCNHRPEGRRTMPELCGDIAHFFEGAEKLPSLRSSCFWRYSVMPAPRR